MSIMASPIVEYPELISPILREGYGYWRGKRGDRSFPSRHDFDPLLEIPKLARHMMLLDVLRDPLDFRYRLIGDKLRDHMGENWVGRRWSEIPQQRLPNPIWMHHQWVVENGEPRFIRPNYVGPHHQFMFIESAVLPLGDDPERVEMLMLFVDFLSKVGR
jgi:hypothetical protein